MTMEKLKIKHDIVKNHKYRLARDTKYSKAYGNALRDMIDCFYDTIKTTELGKRNGIWYFFHEACSNAYHFHDGETSYKKYYEDGKQMDIEIMFAVERTIGNIHNFINTGNFDMFHTYYTGSNVGKHGRFSEYNYNKNNNTYEMRK